MISSFCECDTEVDSTWSHHIYSHRTAGCVGYHMQRLAICWGYYSSGKHFAINTVIGIVGGYNIILGKQCMVILRIIVIIIYTIGRIY